jgi:hypothetical protein
MWFGYDAYGYEIVVMEQSLMVFDILLLPF